MEPCFPLVKYPKVGVMFEAELSDMIVDFMAVFFCLLAWRLKCGNKAPWSVGDWNFG